MAVLVVFFVAGLALLARVGDNSLPVVPAKAGTHMWTAPVAQELFDV
jgi:hypothetical protein